MKRISAKHIVSIIAGCVAFALGTPVLAASTWGTPVSGGTNLGSLCGGGGVSTGVAMGNTLSCGTQGGVTMSVNGFSTSNGTTSTTGTVFANAAVYNWGNAAGLGVVNQYENPSATGPHAVDNQYGTDAIRLNFTSAMSLTSIGIGWTGASGGTGGDTDFSVLAWTGTSTPCAAGTTAVGSLQPASAVAGTTLTGSQCSSGTTIGSSLLTSGWTLIGNVSNQGGFTSANFTTGISSSYWLVTAYNTAFAGGSFLTSNTTALDAANATTGIYDAFKLLSVAGNVGTQSGGGKVPEPGSLALVGVGLLGLVASRRRKSVKI